MAAAATADPASSKDSAAEEITQGVNPWWIAAAVMLATFMEVLDTSIAAVALPYIAGSLSATNDEATWVLTSYLVANATILPASNWFSLRFGRKRFLITCVIIFTVASFACGAAPTLAVMLAARVVQGAGGGALQPLSQAILLESFPPAKRGAATAVFAFGVVVAPVVGPTLGGWLTDTYSWRYAFYLNIPVGILAVIMISRFVHDPSYISKAKAPLFDRIGFGLLCVWTGCLQVILDKGQEVDWFGALWLRWMTLFLVVSFIWFVYHSWTAKDPLVELKLFKNWNFLIGCVLIFLFGISIYSSTTLVPLFYQELLGYTAFTAGLAVAPRGIGAVLGMPVIGVLSSKLDARYLLTFGFFSFGLATFYLGSVTTEISPTTLFMPILISGFALSFIFVPITTAAYGTLRNDQIGSASGVFNLMRNIGGSIGISLAQTMLTRRSASHQSELTNYIPTNGLALQSALRGTEQSLTGYFGQANAAFAAQSTLYRQLGMQALDWAFVEVFRWLAVLSCICVLCVWLLRKVKPGKAPEGAH